MAAKQKSRRAFYRFFAVGILLFIFTEWAQAEEKFPTRPISIIVCWSPGGVSHMNAQVLQPLLAKALHVGVEIINKPGASGTIGWNYAANSPPDGYTVAQSNPSLILTPYTTKTGVSYDKFDDIIIAVKFPGGIFVKADSPWKSFREFIDYAKAHPGKVQMGTTGIGASYHIGTLGLEMVTGTKFTQVPFKGSGPIVTALLGGHVDGTFIELTTGIPFVEAKKFRCLAVSYPVRSFVLPDVPTLRELGFDLNVPNWQGYSVPKGTPKERIKIIHDAFKAAMDSEEYKAYCKKQGGMIEYVGLEDVRAFLDNEDKFWKKIIEFSGFKPTE